MVLRVGRLKLDIDWETEKKLSSRAQNVLPFEHNANLAQHAPGTLWLLRRLGTTPTTRVTAYITLSTLKIDAPQTRGNASFNGVQN